MHFITFLMHNFFCSCCIFLSFVLFPIFVVYMNIFYRLFLLFCLLIIVIYYFLLVCILIVELNLTVLFKSWIWNHLNMNWMSDHFCTLLNKHSWNKPNQENVANIHPAFTKFALYMNEHNKKIITHMLYSCAKVTPSGYSFVFSFNKTWTSKDK